MSAIGTVGALGGVTAFMSQGASATAGGNISDPEVFTSDNGTVDWVSIQTTGRLNWEGFDEPVREFKIRTQLEMKRNGNTLWTGQINETNRIDATQDDWGGDGEEISLEGDYGEGRAGYIASDTDWGVIQRNRENIYNNGYGLPENPAPASYLTSNSDGDTTSTRVVITSTYLLFGPNGNELTGQDGYPNRPSSTSDFVVSVENRTSSTSFGSKDAEGDEENSAEVGIQ